MRINSHELLFVWYRRAKSERFSKDATIEINRFSVTASVNFFIN